MVVAPLNMVIQLIPKVFYRIEVWTLGRPVQSVQPSSSMPIHGGSHKMTCAFVILKRYQGHRTSSLETSPDNDSTSAKLYYNLFPLFYDPSSKYSAPNSTNQCGLILQLKAYEWQHDHGNQANMLIADDTYKKKFQLLVETPGIC
ncbi:hypothetical protein TNCV_2249821 [Trichonephila clavipes]|nr:hypothetical protein TNCV_2249821 [Trichonephila clavipes]